MEDKMVHGQFDLKNIKGVKGNSAAVDLRKYDKKETTIAEAHVVRVPSQYSETGYQWSLRVLSDVLETIDGEEGPIEFRASELFNLVQDEEGNLTGFPTGDGSNLMRFMRDIGITKADKLEDLAEVIEVLKGKKVLIKSYEKGQDDKKKTYLKFRY